MACVAAVRDEIEILRVALTDKGCPQELYEASLAQLKAVAAPGLFAAGWNQIVDRIGIDHLMMLRWAGWVLGQQEALLADEERAALLADVEQVLARIKESSIPTFTQQMVARHLEAVRRALLAYRVQGVEPLSKALNETTGAMTTQKGHIVADVAKADAEEKGLLAKAMGVIHQAAELADKAEKFHKGIDSTIKIAHQISNLWQQLPNIPLLPS